MQNTVLTLIVTQVQCRMYFGYNDLNRQEKIISIFLRLKFIPRECHSIKIRHIVESKRIQCHDNGAVKPRNSDVIYFKRDCLSHSQFYQFMQYTVKRQYLRIFSVRNVIPKHRTPVLYCLANMFHSFRCIQLCQLSLLSLDVV